MNTGSITHDDHARRQKTARMLSLITCVLCFAAIFVGGRLLKHQESFPFDDFSGISTAETLSAYEESGSAEDLIVHLKALCYQAKIENDPSVREDIADYGTILLDMARAEEIDLERLGNKDETLLDLLKMIRGYGAK